jgi:DNA modification methylase
MKNFKIFNKSSTKIPEIENCSVDLIIAGPPYNIGTKYGNNSDTLPFISYKKMIKKVASECFRTLKKNGIFVIEASDSVLMNGSYVQLSGLIQSICIKSGFNIQQRHVNFANSISGVELIEDKRWKNDYSTNKNSHSNCHQWLVFRKSNCNFIGGEIYYIPYEETKEHPCPFPIKTCELFLSKYFKKNMTVLDPFMGTANLGELVILNGGKYIGYEIDKLIYEEALKKLSK